jgi:hypothetical protein
MQECPWTSTQAKVSAAAGTGTGSDGLELDDGALLAVPWTRGRAG